MTDTQKPLWTSEEIAAYTNGAANGSFVANGISIDTRSLQPGDLFIALKGDALDGHAYVDKAFENGAGGALVSAQTAHPHIKVDDTFTALYDLAQGARERADSLTALAVTGSVGKTGTKEMLAHVLRSIAPSHATSGNLNNHWGLPVTLTRMPQHTRFGIFEMGMSHSGEITPLSRLVKPDIAIITWVAAAHIEFFNSIEAIARAKAEIFDGMSASGTAILPFDNEQFHVLVGEARTKGIATILSFGKNPQADAHILSISNDVNGQKVTASILDEKVTFTLKQFGEHHAGNALAVLLAVKALEQDIQKAAQALESFSPVKGRGNMMSLSCKSGTITVIDETYNASPIATKAAVNVLGTIPHKGRRIAVLGDMLELGNEAGALHAGLSSAIQSNPIDKVLCCGSLMKNLHDTLPDGLSDHFPDSAALADAIPSLIETDDILMVKGSHGSHMEKIIEKLSKICS